jgi:hypothetical protein
VIYLSDEESNALDSMSVDFESLGNKIDERDIECEKDNKQAI